MTPPAAPAGPGRAPGVPRAVPSRGEPEPGDHVLTWPLRGLVVTVLAALGLFLAAELVLWASLGQLQATSTEGDGLFFVVMLTAFAAAAAAGTVIITRQPRNMIGWLLLAMPVCAAFALTAGDYATYALVTAPGSLPFRTAAAWIDRWAIVPALCLPIPLFLLFPDGHVPSGRWRPVLWLALAAPAVTTVLFAVSPGRMTGAFAQLTSVRVINPLGIRGAGGVIRVLSLVGGFSCPLAACLAGAALVA